MFLKKDVEWFVVTGDRQQMASLTRPIYVPLAVLGEHCDLIIWIVTASKQVIFLVLKLFVSE